MLKIIDFYIEPSGWYWKPSLFKTDGGYFEGEFYKHYDLTWLCFTIEFEDAIKLKE
jgi:hypothetical protein